MKTKIFFAVVIALIGVVPAQTLAQHSGQLGAFDMLPQSIYANPALRPAGKLNVGIPALSGVYVGHHNNWYNPNAYMTTDEQGVATLSGEAILSQIDDFAETSQGVGVELLHVGFKLKEKHYIHVRATERAQASIKIPRDVFALAVYGNTGNNTLDNNTADFSELNLDGIHYREYTLGYSFSPNEKWTFGIAAKYLYGMERIQTETSNLKIYTDPLTFQMTSSGTFAVNTAGVYGAMDEDSEAIHSDMKTYVSGLKNHGFGADLGLVYHPTEKLQLEFSANDFGMIKWKSDVANYTTGNGEFAYNGISLTDFIFATDSEFDDALENELDSLLSDLEDRYEFEKTEEEFTTNINGYLRYAASWELLKTQKMRGKVWANAMHGVFESQTPFSFAVGYNHTFWRNIQLGLHYSKRSNATGSFGGGIALSSGPAVIYFMAENMRFANMTQVNVVDDQTGEREASIMYFSNPNDIRINFGVNISIFEKDKKTSRSYY